MIGYGKIPNIMGWLTQSDDKDTKVQVSGDHCRDGRERTDFLIIDKEGHSYEHISIGAEADSEPVSYGDRQQDSAPSAESSSPSASGSTDE